jgi:hypothetical protein
MLSYELNGILRFELLVGPRTEWFYIPKNRNVPNHRCEDPEILVSRILALFFQEDEARDVMLLFSSSPNNF